MDKQALYIERYLNDGMNSSERMGFESEMECDPFLSEAVDGFRQDPGALYDLPVSPVVKINWWWSIVGFVAAATVFLSIPNEISEIAEFSISTNKILKVDLQAIPREFEVQPAPTFDIVLIETPEKSQTSEIKEANVSADLLTAEFLDPKSANLIHKTDIPTLKVEEKIIYILDLKVVKPQFQKSAYQETDLSELTDFTPANFSTTVAYKRAKKYESIFPESKAATYLEKLESGLRYFKAEDYTKALRVFSMLLENNNFDSNAQFYSALSHYYLGNYKAAEAGFERMNKSGAFSFAPESKWYRALSLQELGRADEAHGLLLEIADGGGHYAPRAKLLLK